MEYWEGGQNQKYLTFFLSASLTFRHLATFYIKAQNKRQARVTFSPLSHFKLNNTKEGEHNTQHCTLKTEPSTLNTQH